MEYLSEEEIDFNAYLRATESQEKVREATVFLNKIRDDILNPQVIAKVEMPWSKSFGTFDFKPGEVTLYAGTNGGGKSLITGQIALGLVKQQQKVCLMSFEMKPERTLSRMLRQFSGEDLTSPLFMNKASKIPRLIDRFWKFTDKKMWLYDQQGTVSTDQVIAVTRYCAVELGINHIFIDSLMKCVKGEDDYNSQKYFVDELTALARDHNVHIHLVHHIRKLTSEEIMPNKKDVRGASAISDMVDNVLLVHRNKLKEAKVKKGEEPDPFSPDTYLMCEKQRNGEAEEWYSLWFNRDSQQFVEGENDAPMAFDTVGSF